MSCIGCGGPDCVCDDGLRPACLPCARCGANLQPVGAPGRASGDGGAQPLGGVQFRGTPAYGSAHDLSGELEINLCDVCVAVAARRGRVNEVRVHRTELVERRQWTVDPTIDI